MIILANALEEWRPVGGEGLAVELRIVRRVGSVDAEGDARIQKETTW